jgi:type IV pilus assembly protein PilC
MDLKAIFGKSSDEEPKKLRAEQLIAFCSEMSLYLRAGNPVPECFYIFLKQEKPYIPKSSVVELYSETEMGTPLCEAMQLTGIFPDHLLSMVDAGERTGHLEEVFRTLSSYYEGRRRTRANLRSAILYPAILLCITILVVFVILPEVLPIYNEAFAELGGTMPPFTFILIKVASAIGSAHWYILGVLAAAALYFGVTMLVPKLRDAFLSRARTRFYKKAAGRKLNSAFFVSLLSLGVSGGLDIDETMKMIEDSFADRFGPNSVTACRADIASGTGFAKAVENAGLLNSVDASILGTGIATGNTDIVLGELTERTDTEAREALDRSVGRVEPAIVLVMAIVVGVVLIAVMFPLLGIMSAIT